jgi:hypothetical protein
MKSDLINELEREIILLARNRPKYRGVMSTRAEIIFLKQKYKLNDYELCEILENMQNRGLIKEFVYTYTDRGIYTYWFK